MRGWQGGRTRVFCLCAAFLFLAARALGIPVDPNNGAFHIGDSINFNYDENQIVFDPTIGTKGALVDFNGDENSATITSANPNYAFSSYTVGIRWEVPLLEDFSNFMGTQGKFGNESGQPALSWSLVDRENGDAVLLSGKILDSTADPTYDFIIGELEFVAPAVMFPANGGGAGGLIGLTVTGGLLKPVFPPEIKMNFSCFVTPNPSNFDNGIWTTGAGSVTMWAVPEPGTVCLLLGGAVFAFGRRRKA